MPLPPMVVGAATIANLCRLEGGGNLWQLHRGFGVDHMITAVAIAPEGKASSSRRAARDEPVAAK